MMEDSVLFRVKNKGNLGLCPGQVRYDSLLKTLTAIKRFLRALHIPPTEEINKMDKICSETFCFTQAEVMRRIQEKMKLAKRRLIIQKHSTSFADKIAEEGNTFYSRYTYSIARCKYASLLRSACETNAKISKHLSVSLSVSVSFS